MGTEKQELLEIIIVSSPMLKKTRYSYKDIIDTDSKGFFSEGDITAEEILEDYVQKIANYDSFYNAPHPIDKGEVREITRIKKLTKENLIKVCGVLIIAAALYVLSELVN